MPQQFSLFQIENTDLLLKCILLFFVTLSRYDNNANIEQFAKVFRLKHKRTRLWVTALGICRRIACAGTNVSQSNALSLIW